MKEIFNVVTMFIETKVKKTLFHFIALDAYCLLEVYDALAKQCAQMEIDFHEISAQVQHIPHKSPKKAFKKATPSRVCH